MASEEIEHNIIIPISLEKKIKQVYSLFNFVSLELIKRNLSLREREQTELNQEKLR